ncbi:hemerythrin-like metal-binding protein [Elusimicrobium simillimum]|uniref:hemerythrin domain-containing protein n=1 Tax=Elusimicrobium simillimum TaxID=3143438 RepID=UPI003C704CE9
MAKTLEFLVAYTVKHFEDEERLQKENDYADYLVHKSYHDEFKRVVGGFVTRLNKEGYDNELMAEVITALASWLKNHIKGEDFKMAAYVLRHKK